MCWRQTILYPIPAGAVFTNFSLFSEDQELRGEMLPADRARAIYEDIVRRRRDPALVELFAHSALRARVFPIELGQLRRVVLRYTQILERDGGTLRLRYPSLVGLMATDQLETGEGLGLLEQSSAEARRPPGDVRRLPAVGGADDAMQPFTLRIRLLNADAFAIPYSPTHELQHRQRAANELELVYAGDPERGRDFDLFLPLREGPVGVSVATHNSGDEEGFFMLLVSPPANMAPANVIPRDVSLVLDTSGSMSGTKIAQATAGLKQILEGLTPKDRFRLITFNSVSRIFDDGFLQATPDNVRLARQHLEHLQPGGSTNFMEALRLALAPATSPQRLALAIILSDGKPMVGETDPVRITEEADRLRDDERVFAIGVGYDVNTYLLDRLTAEAHGKVSYVRPEEDIENAVASLTRKLDHPALVDLRIVEAPPSN